MNRTLESMNGANMNWRISAVAALTLAGLACTPEDASNGHAGLSTTMTCPSGQIGWNFGTDPLDPLADEYQVQAADAAVEIITPIAAIDVQDSTCGDRRSDGGYDTSQTGAARQACGGSRNCSFTPQCSGAFTVSWSCGIGNNPDGGLRTATRAAGATTSVTLSCTSSATTLPARPARTACVPALCRGQTRRGPDLSCVADTTLTKVTANPGDRNYQRSDFRVAENLTFTPKYKAFTTGDSTRDNNGYVGRSDFAVLNDNNVYRVRGKFRYGTTNLDGGSEFSEIPQNARVRVWLADAYSVGTYGINGWTIKSRTDVVLGYRCTIGAYDVGRRAANAQGEIVVDKNVMISRDCVAPGREEEVWKDAARRAGMTVANFKAQYAYAGTVMYYTYDIEGRTQYIPVGHDSASACAPNPPEFYYDATTQSYDMVSYLQQRPVAEPKTYGTYNAVLSYNNYFAIRPSTRIEIGPTSIALRDTTLEIPLYSPILSTVPIDITWYMANDRWDHNYSMVGKFATMELSSGVPPFAGDAWDATANGVSSTPPNMRAVVYILPTNPTGPLKQLTSLGSIPFESASPTGSLISADFVIKPAVKNLFVTSGTDLYIDPTTNLRSFELLFCIMNDRTDLTWNSSPFSKSPLKFEYSEPTREQTANNLDYDSIGLGNEADTVGAWSPYSNVKPGRGCRFSKKPLLISIDRAVRPLVPVVPQDFTGTDGTNASGDNNMEQTQDNDGSRTCTGNRCSSAATSGQSGTGEFARTYYRTSSTGDINEGADVQGDATSEALGFNVLSSADEEDKTPWPTTVNKSTPPITITIAPPWDDIRSKLHEAARGSPIEWEKGRYAGIMGLGVGWGFKIPIQMGPVPGLITISASVGVAIELEFKWRLAPEDDADKYPCIGSTNCYQVNSDLLTQPNAAKQCYESGGRLAELSSQTEAGLVSSKLGGVSGQDSFWIGAQLAYKYPTEDCGRSYNSSTCASTTKTSYRWLSNDKEFASATGSGPVTYVGTQIFAGGSSPLSSQMPSNAGIVYKKDGTITTALHTETHPSICVYEAATSASYHEFSLALGLGAAVGIGISFCVPNDEIGFCIEGTLNLVNVKIEPTFSYAMQRLTNGTRKAKHSLTKVEIPWEVTLLSGEVKAKIALWFTEISWTLLEFEGFKVAEGKLYEFSSPNMEQWK